MASAYGAAGSLVVVLVWVYYASQILLFGAQFTQVYATTFHGTPPVSGRASPERSAAAAEVAARGRAAPRPMNLLHELRSDPMPLSANPAARTALTYITTGTMLDITATVWYFYTRNLPAGAHDHTWGYIQLWMLLIGVALVVIGLTVGRIGREARHADAPPAPPMEAAATAQARLANAAATPVTAGGVAPGTPVYMVPPVAGTAPVVPQATAQPGIQPGA